MKQFLKLINDSDNQNALDIRFGDSSPTTWNYTDICLDGNGALQLIDGDESRVQSVLKCLFTERQSNGYGANLYSLIGEKDMVVKRLCIFLDLTMAIMSLKLFADEQKEAQDLQDEDLIDGLTQLVCTEDPENPTISRIKLTLKPVNGTAVNVGVL